jgi:hypothetical protein
MPDYDWKTPTPQSSYEDPAAHNAAKRLIVKAFRYQPSPVLALSDAFNISIMAAARLQIIAPPPPDLIAAAAARTILFGGWFDDQETAFQIGAHVTRSLIAYQNTHHSLMGVTGGHA